MKKILYIFIFFSVFGYGQTATNIGGLLSFKQSSYVAPVAPQELKAFPTAEGFGRYASGGRGGAVFAVTNLNDSGTGSLRWALSQTATSRTIVFRVCGIIEATNYMVVPANTTIAGETACGGGILIKNGELRIQNSNIIVRHVKARMTSTAPNQGDPYYNIKPFRVKGYDNANPIKRIILDHVSASWGNDENIAVTVSDSVTVQWSIFGENSKNFLTARIRWVSALNNFLVQGYGRNLLSNTSQSGEFAFEFVNNIVFGHKYGTSGGEGQRFNVINNKYVRTKSDQLDVNYEVTLAPTDPENGYKWGEIEDTKMYVVGNNVQYNIDTRFTGYTFGAGWSGGQLVYRPQYAQYTVATPYDGSGYIPTSANNDELDSKILATVGASLTRDSVDAGYITDYQTKQGGSNNSGTMPTIAGGTPYTDSDGDGIEDSWETNIGGTIGSMDNNGDHDNDGYTNLEEYLHYRAGE